MVSIQLEFANFAKHELSRTPRALIAAQMRVDHESIAPDINSLTGTNGEAACHFHALQVSIEAEPVSPLFQDTLYTVFITSESILLYDQDTKSLVVLDYKEIILHAILSGEATIYMQIESNSVAALYSGNDGSNDMDMVGIYLKPSDSLSSKCTSLFLDLFAQFVCS